MKASFTAANKENRINLTKTATETLDTNQDKSIDNHLTPTKTKSCDKPVNKHENATTTNIAT